MNIAWKYFEMPMIPFEKLGLLYNTTFPSGKDTYSVTYRTFQGLEFKSTLSMIDVALLNCYDSGSSRPPWLAVSSHFTRRTFFSQTSLWPPRYCNIFTLHRPTVCILA
jgi:hypothetical protein